MITPQIEENFNSTKQAFYTYSLLSIALFFVIYLMMSVTIDTYRIVLSNSKKLYILGAVGCVYLTFLITKIEYSFKKLYKIVIFFIFTLLYVHCLFHCSISYFVYTFLIPVVVSLFFVTDFIKASFVEFMAILLVLNVKTIASLLNINQIEIFTKDDFIFQLIFDIVTLIMSISYSIIMFYYLRKIKNFEYQYDNEIYLIEANDKRKFVSIGYNEVLNSELEKLNELFNEIIIHLERSKSYRNPVFSRKLLASILETNTTYISRAIKINSKQNFNTLINEYRIKEVIAEFNLENYKIFTIEHIYTKAGFTQQPTFNRVFKEFTGKTPSQYIELINERKSTRR